MQPLATSVLDLPMTALPNADNAAAKALERSTAGPATVTVGSYLINDQRNPRDCFRAEGHQQTKHCDDVADGFAGAMRYPDLPKDPAPSLLTILQLERGYVEVNDWYIVPLAQQTGPPRRITEPAAIDGFGVVTVAPPVDAEDWQAFALAADEDSDSLTVQGLSFAPNSAPAIVSNDDLEDVRFLTDENTNLVWAFEQAYRIKNGQIVRNGDATAPPQAEDAIDPPGDAELPTYRFAAAAPPSWIPRLPRAVRGQGDTIVGFYLWRGRTDTQASADHPQYRTRIVAETWRLSEHEVPLDGIRVRRTHRYARSSDGRADIWIGRRAERTPAPRFLARRLTTSKSKTGA